MIKKALPILLIAITFNSLNAQVINGYANVTSISGTTLNLNNVDEANDAFEDGEEIIIMQMQDDVIGSNTANNSSFGLLNDIASAGLYEVARIVSHTEVAGVPTSITIARSFTNKYNTGANSSLQIITFPQLGSPDYTSGDISAKSWDGNTGGIVALQVKGTLTIGGNIDVSTRGFRGGTANRGGSTGCSGASNFRVNAGANHANKGEGIYKSTASNYVAGRARILNGGGGGNSHNAGGGGGGNFSAGGLGGPGWPNCNPSAGGIGGINLNNEISAHRVFMGGGGGSGEGNNNGTARAGNGGGIIFIRANSIVTTGTSAGYTLSADGEAAMDISVNDGNSGGGAGGSVVIEVNNWNIAPTSLLTVAASGGNGGNVSTGSIHGGGGGGGQGAVIYSISQPTTNTTTTTNNGVGGKHCNTCGTADPGSMADGAGIIDLQSGPMPVRLLSFHATPDDDNVVHLTWQTIQEKNNDYFTVERSVDQLHWEEVTIEYSHGNSTSLQEYEALDEDPFPGTSYYRLKETDVNGNDTYSETLLMTINLRKHSAFTVYPNPMHNELIIDGNHHEIHHIRIYKATGQDVTELINVTDVTNTEVILDVSRLGRGMYVIKNKHAANTIFKD